jgi:hypothetical protein
VSGETIPFLKWVNCLRPLPQVPFRRRALGATAQERQLASRRLFDVPPAADELDTIRTDLQSQHALGSTRFQMAIERQLARRVGPAKAPPAAKW